MIKRLTNILLFLGLFFGLLFSPVALSKNGIVGGRPAAKSDWQSVVALRTTTTNEAFCGGNLIHPRWVITAAHCLKQEIEGIEQRYSASDIVIFAGSHNLKDIQKSQRITVRRIIIHPQFRTSAGDHDIALLELTQNARSPIMRLFSLDPLPQTAVTAVGWGSLNRDARGHYPDRLYQVNIPVVARDKCQQASLYKNRISNNMLCAGLTQGGKDSCIGDSGGPLMLRQISDGKYYQVGIVSHGHGCGRANQYGVYTLIPAYIDWIKRYAPIQVSTNPNNEIVYQRMAGMVSYPTLLFLTFLVGFMRTKRHNKTTLMH
jgi:secreted trypsin-like serine protease